MPHSLLDINILIFLSLLGIFVIGGHLLANHSRFFSQTIDRKRNNEHYESHLEGLRGILAFGVFVHHAAFIWSDLDNGGWRKPESHFMDMLGGASVSMFFFLSGYLFWKGFLNRNSERLSVSRFYKERFFRLAPVYWLFCIVMIVVVLWDAGGVLRTTFSEFFIAVGQWLVFGIPLGRFPDVNEFPFTRLIHGGVAWSLRHEVLFYLLLPLLLPFARRQRTLHVLALFVCSYVIFTGIYLLVTKVFTASGHHPLMMPALSFLKEGLMEFNKFLLTGFAPGMLTAYVLHHDRYSSLVSGIKTRHALWTVIVCLLLLLLNADPRFSFLKIFPLTIIFFLVVAKKVGTEFLRIRGLMVLGLVSYSVYVFHGLFLFFLQPQGLGIYKAINWPGLPAYWFLICLVGLLVLGVSALLYRFVEEPSIQLGKRQTQGAWGR